MSLLDFMTSIKCITKIYSFAKKLLNGHYMQGLVLGIKKTKTKANLKVKNRQEKNKKQMIPQ